MTQDFFIDAATNDWSLENGTTIRLCETQEELIRQRLAINLNLFFGEWFANTNIGVPYFESVYGKNTKNSADSVFRQTIKDTEGVIKITSFNSDVSKDRKYTLTFSVTSDTGPIENIEVTLSSGVTS